MAIGKASDFVIYQAEFQSGMVEKAAQFLQLFNAGTRGAIRLVPRALKGHYGKEAFFKDVSSLVSRRDITDVSAVTDLALTQDENISVKINRKIGPVAQTLDAMKKAGMDEGAASRAFGELAASRKLKDMVNTALIAVEAAIQGNSAMNLDITGEATKTASRDALNRTLALFGDARQDIVCWVGHSHVNTAILSEVIASGVTGLEDIVSIQGALPAWLGRPSIITDAGALTDANASATDTYNTLGLVEGAVVVEESEDDTFVTELVSGYENIFRRFQSEYAYNVSVKGFKWDTTNGGVNPTDSALGTTTNWDQVATDDKHTAGVRLLSQ
jgi:hypothetical protein